MVIETVGGSADCDRCGVSMFKCRCMSDELKEHDMANEDKTTTMSPLVEAALVEQQARNAIEELHATDAIAYATHALARAYIGVPKRAGKTMQAMQEAITAAEQRGYERGRAKTCSENMSDADIAEFGREQYDRGFKYGAWVTRFNDQRNSLYDHETKDVVTPAPDGNVIVIDVGGSCGECRPDGRPCPEPLCENRVHASTALHRRQRKSTAGIIYDETWNTGELTVDRNGTWWP